MAILNCLWVGALAGMVGSRLIRSGEEFAPPANSIAVGILGAFLGILTRSRLESLRSDLPHVDIVTAGMGAAIALMAWNATQRLCIHKRSS